MIRALAENPITEDFAGHSGVAWLNYDAYDTTQRNALGTQQHLDLVSFRDSSSLPLAQYTADYTDITTAAGSTLGPQVDRHGWPGVVIPVTGSSSATITTSYAPSVDLLTNFTDVAAISLACPSFPLAKIDLTQSKLRFTSIKQGVTKHADLLFSQTIGALANGDSELRWARTALNALDLDSVTSVAFTIYATTTLTFRAVGLRLIAPGWTYAPVDTNTLAQSLVNPPTLTGASARVYTFPTNSITSGLVPHDFPIMLRAGVPAGGQDPKPVDATLQCSFFTGAKASQNHIRLFFREFPAALVTQLDLDGETQDDIDGIGHQPDYTDGDIVAYSPRTMADLDGLTMGDLDGRLQIDLERYPNYLYSTWQEVRIEWGTGGDSVTIQDTEGNSYYFSSTSSNAFSLAANKFYYAIASLEDTTFRLRVYNITTDVDAYGDPKSNLGTLVFDTGAINDDGLFARRRGRIGWYANLLDGDAYVTEVRERSATFAEYRSHSLRGITPIDGLQLYAACACTQELFTGFTAKGATTVEADHVKSTSGDSWKVAFEGDDAGPNGVFSNVFELHDPREVAIRFAMNFPAAPLVDGPNYNPPQVQLIYVGAKPFAYISLDEDASVYTFTMPPIVPDTWQDFEFYLDVAERDFISGNYVLSINQPGGTGLPSTTWYLDKASVEENTISWSGRAERADAWGYDDTGWTPFRNVFNSSQKGVLFPVRGKSPQVRAQARRQAATISQIQIVPRYAHLGRLVWTDESLPLTTKPSVSFTTASSSLTHGKKFSGTATPTAGNTIVLVYFSFGDGTVLAGSDVEHAFPEAGDFAVTITAVDDKGNRSTYSNTVTIT